MAEINQTSNNGIKKRTLSTRVDLTRMVDLGFILITFFIFTTTITTPTTMKLNLPDDSQVTDPTTTSEKKTLTLVLANENDIYYYRGMPGVSFAKTTYHPSGIRVVINNMLQQVAREFGNKKETTIIIKPTSNASFENLVDVLDEMLINEVGRYVMVEPDKVELETLEMYCLKVYCFNTAGIRIASPLLEDIESVSLTINII